MPPTRRAVLALISAVLLLSFDPAARAQEKFYRPDLTAKYLESSFKTDWYGVYLQNKKIGFVRGERKRQDGKIVEEQIMSLKLVSFNKKVEIWSKQTLVFQGTAPYRMLSATLIESAAGMDKKTTFTWRSGLDYDSVHEVAGQKRTELIEGIDYTLADASGTEVWVQQNPKIGDTIRSRNFDPSDSKMDVHVSKILSSKESLAGGVKVRFYEVETEAKLHEIKSISRYDDQGNTLSAVIAVFELRREKEEQAKDTEYSQDLFVLGMVKIDKAIGHTTQLRELVVAVDGKEGAAFEDGPRQSVEDTGNGTRLIRIGKQHGKVQKATAAEIKEALAATNNYPIAHAKIKGLADKVTAGAKSDEEKVAKIVAFVHDYVTPYLSASAPNIYDLLEQKKGDCKSYALMFNNLARAAGVPAREVAGLLYTGDDQKAFGGHAWNEVVLNGVWVPVDASLGETEVDAGHVCFGPDHKATSKLLTSLGKLSFRLVEVKRAP